VTLCCLHSGTPGGAEREVAGDLREVTLVAAHRRLLDVVRDAIHARLDDAESTAPDPWADFSCNRCLARFGKPHWTDDGPSGPTAARARWRGAWARDEAGARRQLPVLKASV
jgi:hypothetical protein